MYNIRGLPISNDNTKVTNHCIVLAKYQIYLHKLKGNDHINKYAYPDLPKPP